MNKLFKINDNDNVAIALESLAKGVWISLTEWGMDVSNFVLSEFLL